MKTKLLISITVFLSLWLNVYGQSMVMDPLMIATLRTISSNEQGAYDDIKGNQNQIQTYQILINSQLEKIKKIEDKTVTYLKTVNSVVRNSKDIVYASDIVSDVAEYQSRTMAIASQDPELLVIGLKTEYELVTRGLEVVQYIYNFALKDGEDNMLDNKQRTDMIRHVIDELRLMRGMSYSIYRQMKTAQRANIMNSIDVENFRYY